MIKDNDNEGMFWNKKHKDIRPEKLKVLGDRPSWNNIITIKTFLYELIQFKLSFRDYSIFICIALLSILIGFGIPWAFNSDTYSSRQEKYLPTFIASFIILILATVLFILRFLNTFNISYINLLLMTLCNVYSSIVIYDTL